MLTQQYIPLEIDSSAREAQEQAEPSTQLAVGSRHSTSAVPALSILYQAAHRIISEASG